MKLYKVIVDNSSNYEEEDDLLYETSPETTHYFDTKSEVKQFIEEVEEDNSADGPVFFDVFQYKNENNRYEHVLHRSSVVKELLVFI